MAKYAAHQNTFGDFMEDRLKNLPSRINVPAWTPQRRAYAHRKAVERAKADPSDPFTYKRLMSHYRKGLED